MIVIADTSPLNYLILIGQEELLNKLFGTVTIPQVMFDELRDIRASAKVRDWAQNFPNWIEVKHTNLAAPASLNHLDEGEKEAILLAQALSADLLLLDDKQGRQAALELGLAVTGTVGVLDRAAREGLIDLREIIESLTKTNFRISEDVIRELLEKD